VSFVGNYPTKYNDPTGHWPGTGTHDSDADSLLFSYMHVNLSSDLEVAYFRQENGISMASQYRFMPGHYNLCGHIAMQMVYETATGAKNTLQTIYDNGLPIGTSF